MKSTPLIRPSTFFALLVAALAGTLAACGPTDPKSCTITCSDRGQCPDGTRCADDGYCYAPDEEPGSCVLTIGDASPPDAAIDDPDAADEPDGSPPDAGPEPDACTGRDSFASFNDTDIDIPDASPIGVTSTIVVAPVCPPVTSIQIRLDITHTFRGDLRIFLTPPGAPRVLIPTPSGGDDDIHQAFPVDVAVAPVVDGTWVLTASDVTAEDVGFLDRWSIGIDEAAPSP